MHRLLIVDNEPTIVKGLFELFVETRREGIELDVYCAYSAREALAWMERVKIDVVLSDIRMPGISGLELQNLIRRQWPKCKVVFLTGYNDFEYARQAIRQGGYNYLLKTDGDEAIVDTVYKAIEAMTQDMQAEHTLDAARKQIQTIKPVLRRYVLQHLLEGRAEESDYAPDRLQETNIALRPECPTMLLLGRVDEWPADLQASGRALYFYAIGNIANDLLEGCVLEDIALDDRHFALFVQSEGVPDEAASGARFIRFVQGTSETIQSTCHRLLKLPISLVVASAPAGWTAIPGVYRRLRELFYRGLGLNRQMLLIDPGSAAHKPQRADDDKPPFPAAVQGAVQSQLQALLENGDGERFFAGLHRYIEPMLAQPSSYGMLSEAYLTIAAVLFGYMNRRGLSGRMENRIELHRLVNPLEHACWSDAFRYLEQCAALLLELTTDERRESTLQVVKRINRYIDDHLNGELSLVRLAEEVHLNPAYLSRLYKQTTGVNLSDHINAHRLAKAKELLVGTPLKIHDIASRVGVESPSYFGRFFKKETSMTPHEYRERYGAVP